MSNMSDALPTPDAIGVFITGGCTDWQVFQRGTDGHAQITLEGLFGGPDGTLPQYRVVSEASNLPVTPRCDWQFAQVQGSRWVATFTVPAGGPYRVETRLSGPWYDMAGDMRHHIGVGDVWLIAGQSNSAGYGRGIVYDEPELGISLFAPSGRWRLASHPLNDHTDTRYPLSRDVGRTGVSPWLAFAKVIRREEGIPIGLIPAALGGSPMSRWDPTREGDLYRNMVEMAKDAGCPRVRGMLWYQGESDASKELAPQYEESFLRMVDSARRELGTEAFAVLTVQLNRVTDQAPGPDRAYYWSVIRDIQRTIANERPDVGIMPALDFTLSDVIHNDAGSNILLGQRMAMLALGMVYGKPGVHLAPQAVAARFVNGDRTNLEIQVAHVCDSLVPVDVTGRAFTVRDEEGEVPITAMPLSAPDRIALTLARECVGETLCHGSYGDHPAVGFVDGRKIPLLGFMNLPVE